MKALWWLVPALPLVPVVGALLLNRPAWFEPPGPWARLKVYLTSHVAETSADSPFPELRPPRFAVSCEQLHARLLQRMNRLGWTVVDAQARQIQAQVVTPLLRFTDDVLVRLEPGHASCKLYLRSASRLGKADFGANQHHLMLLLDGLAPRAGPG